MNQKETGNPVVDRIVRLEDTVASFDSIPHVIDGTGNVSFEASRPPRGTIVITASSPASISIPAPVSGDDDGKQLRFLSMTAQAHVITTPTNKINGNKHIATFGGAVGDCSNLIAFAGAWYLLPSTNIALS